MKPCFFLPKRYSGNQHLSFHPLNQCVCAHTYREKLFTNAFSNCQLLIVTHTDQSNCASENVKLNLKEMKIPFKLKILIHFYLSIFLSIYLFICVLLIYLCIFYSFIHLFINIGYITAYIITYLLSTMPH